MAMNATMIHKARALYRVLVDDEAHLPKQKLIELFLHDQPTRISLSKISGFIAHAVSIEGSFEVALDRMKTKTQNQLDMDEFLAFLNTAAMSMAKGHTPNTSDLMSTTIDRPEEMDQTEMNQRQARIKMMSSTELRSLLRPKSGSRSPMKKKPQYLTQPSPFTQSSSIVRTTTSNNNNGKRRKRRQNTAQVRQLSKTAFGTNSIISEKSSFNITSSSVVHHQNQGNRRSRNRKRPHTAGPSNNNHHHGNRNRKNYRNNNNINNVENDTSAAEMVHIDNGISGTGSVGGGTGSIGGSIVNGNLDMSGGSAMSTTNPGNGSGSSILMQGEEYEWNRSQNYQMNQSYSHGGPPSTTLLSRTINQEQKIRELSLNVLRLVASNKKSNNSLAETKNQLAKLTGTLKSIDTNNSARIRPGTAPMRRGMQRTLPYGVQFSSSNSSGRDINDTNDTNDTNTNQKIDAIDTNGTTEIQKNMAYLLRNKNAEDLKNEKQSKLLSYQNNHSDNVLYIQELEKKVNLLQLRHSTLLEVMSVVPTKGHKYNRPQRDSYQKQSIISSVSKLQSFLQLEIKYSTALEIEVNTRGEDVRRLNHKLKVVERRELNLRKLNVTKKEKLNKLTVQNDSLQEEEKNLKFQINSYREKMKTNVSVEKKMSNACNAMSTYYDRQIIAKGNPNIEIGTNDSALKAGIGGLSKHILNLNETIDEKEEDIDGLKREIRRLNEIIDNQKSAIKQQEHENKIAAQELAIRTALENDKKSTNESSKDGQNGKNNNNEGQKSEQIIDTNNNMSDAHITTIGTNEWKDAAVTMFRLLDLDHDGYISKSELMRATTFMEHKNGGISEALNKLPVLRKQLTPKTYLLTISDMFPEGKNKIDLKHYLHYLSMMQKMMIVPGAKFHDDENHAHEHDIHLKEHISKKDLKHSNQTTLKLKSKIEKEKEKKFNDLLQKKTEKEKKDKKRRDTAIVRRGLPKKRQLDLFQTLLIEEMGDDASRVVQATVRLRHVLASATAIARASSKKFKEAIVKVMHECAAALHCERASLFVVDSEKKKLHAYIGTSQEIEMDLDQGIVGAVVKGNATIIVDDVNEDDRHFNQADLDSGFKTKNMMACPGHDENGRCTVVLEVINRFGSGTFTTLDEILLEIIADISGCFVSHSKKNSELDNALRQRSQVMSTVPSLWSGFLEMDRTSFMQSIEDTVRNAVGATIVSIYMRKKRDVNDIDEKTKKHNRKANVFNQIHSTNDTMFQLDVHRSPVRSYRPFNEMVHEHHHASQWKTNIKWIEYSVMEPGQGVVAKCMRTGMPSQIEDCYNCLDYNPLVDMDVQGMSCVLQPIVKKGIVICVIQAIFPTLRTKQSMMLREMSEQLPPLFDAINVIDTLNGESIMKHSLAVKKASVRIQSMLRGRQARRKKKNQHQKTKSILKNYRHEKSNVTEKMSVGLASLVEADGHEDGHEDGGNDDENSEEAWGSVR